MGGQGSLVLHMLKGLSRAEVGYQRHKAEVMGQIFGSSADILMEQERITGTKVLEWSVSQEAPGVSSETPAHSPASFSEA